MLNKLQLKLGQKLILLAFFAILPPLLAAGGYFYSTMQKQVLAQIASSELNNLHFVKYHLDQEQRHFKSTAKVIATDPALRMALERKNNLGLNNQLNRLADIYPAINYLILLDAEHSVFAINNINSFKQRINGEQIMGAKLDGHPLLPPLIDSPSYSAPGADPYLKQFNLPTEYAQWFSAPVIVRGKPIGWLILSYRWQALTTALEKNLTDNLAKQGFPTLGAAIVNQDNQLMAGSLPKNITVPGRTITLTISGKTFKLIMQVDPAVALKAVEQQRNLLLSVAFVLFVLLLVVFYFVVYQQFLVPIKALDAGTQKFAAGLFDFRLQTQGNDELSHLARSFNAMGEKLEDARTNLKSKVEQRTKQLTLSNIQLESAVAEVTKANNTKSEFLASMSHEIRTPMNGVIGMLALLDKTSLDDKQSHYTHLANTSAHSLLALINDILDFSKIEAGKLDLEMLDFDLEALFADFAETMAIQAELRDIELILDMHKVPYQQAVGDPGRLRQLLNNLVGNSLKFTERGEISIIVSVEQIDDFVQLTCQVKDTGIGIPEASLPTLFSAFTQVDSSTTRNYGGTGLGLAIVRQLCELMGGSVRVHSKEGEGSTFTFDVLLNRSQSSENNVPTLDLSNKRILIVDDNQTSRQMLAKYLEHWGADTAQACDAQQAHALMQNNTNDTNNTNFDIAFIDRQMPVINGLMLIKQLQANDQLNQQTQFVLQTSISRQDNPDLLSRQGIAASLHKPVRVSQLYKTLNKMLQNQSLPQPTEAADTTQSLDMLTMMQGHILLVEDNMINQIVAREILESFGLQVTIACNGQEAIDHLAAATTDYALVIMDCQMPVMDGYQASQNIRNGMAGQGNKDIIIIAMTANAMTGDEEKCLAAGMSDYVSKPIAPTDFHKKLETYLLID